MDWVGIADRVLSGEGLRRDEALAAILSSDDELLPLLHAAFRIRAHHHGRRVRVNVLQNARSGRCPEDCAFCSQSALAESDVPEFPLKERSEIVAGAEAAHAAGASTYCIVTSMTRPSRRDLRVLCEVASEVKERWPGLRVCTSLGLLNDEQAAALAAAGVDRYNHNLESSRNHFPKVVTTHQWEDRVDTVKAARAAGMDVCSGGIFGLGESPEDRVDLAFALRDLSVESVPVNFLDPRPGTALEALPRPSPMDCLKALAMVRLANPQAEDIRMAGGREACLRSLQPLGLYAANSIFADGYLTTPGQGMARDIEMIREAGFIADITAE